MAVHSDNSVWHSADDSGTPFLCVIVHDSEGFVIGNYLTLMVKPEDEGCYCKACIMCYNLQPDWYLLLLVYIYVHVQGSLQTPHFTALCVVCKLMLIVCVDPCTD